MRTRPATFILVASLLGARGVRAAEPAAVVEPLATPPTTMPEAPIELRETDVVHHHHGVAYTVREVRPFQRAVRLDREQVYLALSRPDLARSYRRRWNLDLGLFWTGVAAWFFGIDSIVFQAHPSRDWKIIGLSSMAGTVACFAAVAHIGTDPLSPKELRQAIDVHNAALGRAAR